MKTTILSAADLAYGWDHRNPLAQGIEFTLKAGEILVIQGPNGSGKSTLLKVLLGQHPKKGRVELGIAREKIAILPQLQNLHFHLPVTLGDVLEISVAGKYDEQKAVEYGLLEKHHLRLAWNTASGGERKRALLTRLLLENPQLLFLDEPMNHLDQESKPLVLKSMQNFLRQGDRALVWISHTEGFEAQIGDFPLHRIDLSEQNREKT